MIRIILALSSALLLIISFPAFDLELFAWIALVPLLIAIKNKNLKSAFGLSFLTGISFFMGIFYWINVIKGFTLIDFLFLGIYLGSYFGMFGLLLNFILKRSNFPSFVTAPVLWVSVEYLRSHAGFLALPWALLGHSQYLNLPVIQISSITGTYGVSFLIVMSNVALSEVILYLLSEKAREHTKCHLKPIRPVVVTLLLFGLSLGYGYMCILQQFKGKRINITVIQGNIAQDIKWNPTLRDQILEKHIQLTKQASNSSNASLIVWPETAVQGTLTCDPYLLQTISDLAKATQTSLLIGSSQRPKFGSREFKKKHLFNSAFLIASNGIVKKCYDKINLLPFGEYLPYRGRLPWPSRFVSLADNYTPGKEFTLFALEGVKFGTLICWENLFPDLFRKFVNNGANFMINITNEAWFGETAAPYQFLSMSVFRAVENRVTVVRSANTGISCFIDPSGRIIGKVNNNNKDIFVEGFLTREIPLSQERTLYTRYGDIFAYINLMATIFMLASSFLKVRRDG